VQGVAQHVQQLRGLIAQPVQHLQQTNHVVGKCICVCRRMC
jgi:hypothetical protein